MVTDEVNHSRPGALEPFTVKSLLSVLVPGAVLGAIASGHPPRRIPPPRGMDIAGFSYWAIGAAVLLEWEASAVISGSTWHHPSLTQLALLLRPPVPPAGEAQPARSQARAVPSRRMAHTRIR